MKEEVLCLSQQSHIARKELRRGRIVLISENTRNMCCQNYFATEDRDALLIPDTNLIQLTQLDALRVLQLVIS